MTSGVAMEALVGRMRAAMTVDCGLTEGQGIAVACSGGGDSVALVHLLAACRDGWSVEQVLFVDHGTRDVELEAAASRAAAKACDAPWRSLRVELPDNGNLQAEARRCRYDALLAAAGPGMVIATGHTMDDQAETVLQRLLRGAGLRGLAGIRPREGALIRPLLCIRRQELRDLGLPFSEDPTNSTDRFQRNRLRHSVLPLLELENPRAVEALSRVARQAASEQALLAEVMKRLKDAEPDLRGMDVELVGTWLRWWLQADGGAMHPSRAAVEGLAEQLVLGRKGRASLGQGLVGIIRQGVVSVHPEGDPRDSLVAPSVGVYRMPGASLSVGVDSTGEMEEETLTMHAWMSANEVRWPLTLQRETSSESRAGDHTGRVWRLRDGAGEEVKLAHGAAAGPPKMTKDPIVVELLLRAQHLVPGHAGAL